jgi:hypothetical protein
MKVGGAREKNEITDGTPHGTQISPPVHIIFGIENITK